MPVHAKTDTRAQDRPLRAAVYLRISRDRAGDGLGVERQLQDCAKLADLRGWVIDEAWTLSENDTSATKGRRPKFVRLLGGIQSGAFDVVVAYKIDRLARKMRDLIDLYELAQAHGVILATADGSLDLSTDGGRAQAILLGAISEIEIGNMQDRLKRKALQSVTAGRPANGGSRGFGWEIDRCTVREDEAEVIRYLADKIIDGASLTSMCRYLNDNGLRTPGRRPKDAEGRYVEGESVNRGRWSTPRLRTMLASKRHAGLVTHHGQLMIDAHGEPVKLRNRDGQPVDPIIEPSRHDDLVAAMEARSFTSSGWSTRRSHLLSGLAVCAVCGEKLQAVRTGHTGKPWTWSYRCRTHVSRKRDLLDAYVLGEVARWADEHPIRIEGWDSAEQEATRRQIAAKEGQRRDAVDRFVDSGGDAATLAEITSRLDRQIEELRSARLEMLSNITGADYAQLDLSNLLARSGSLLPSDGDAVHTKGDTIELQRGAIEMFALRIAVLPARPRVDGVKRLRFDPEAVEITWKDPDRLTWRGIVEN